MSQPKKIPYDSLPTSVQQGLGRYTSDWGTEVSCWESRDANTQDVTWYRAQPKDQPEKAFFFCWSDKRKQFGTVGDMRTLMTGDDKLAELTKKILLRLGLINLKDRTYVYASDDKKSAASEPEKPSHPSGRDTRFTRLDVSHRIREGLLQGVDELIKAYTQEVLSSGGDRNKIQRLYREFERELEMELQRGSYRSGFSGKPGKMPVAPKLGEVLGVREESRCIPHGRGNAMASEGRRGATTMAREGNMRLKEVYGISEADGQLRPELQKIVQKYATIIAKDQGDSALVDVYSKLLTQFAHEMEAGEGEDPGELDRGGPEPGTTGNADRIRDRLRQRKQNPGER